MTKRYILIFNPYGEESRESWSVFYCPMFVTDTYDEAKYLGDCLVAEYMNKWYDEERELPEVEFEEMVMIQREGEA